MGYGSTGKFLEYMDVFQKNGIGPRSKILTLGDQTVRIPDQNSLSYIKKFIENYASFNPAKYADFVGKAIHVRRVYEDSGFSYTSIDLNEVDGSIPVDLNMWPNDSLPKQQYDVVTNEGTTEHVTNQMNAFAIIHYLTRPGGIMIHEIPILHFAAHAMTVITPLFLKRLIDGNNYQIIHATMKAHNVSDARAFHHDPCLEFLERFTDTMERSTLAAMAYVVLKKQDNAAYVPPLDIALDESNARPIFDGYIEYFRGPATDSQVALAKEKVRSTAEKPTEKLAAGVDINQKTYNPVKRKQQTAVQPHSNSIHSSQDINVTLRFPFSLRKAFIATSALFVLFGLMIMFALVLIAIRI